MQNTDYEIGKDKFDIEVQNQSKEEINNWYWSMENILIYNHRHLLNHHKRGLFGEKLIKEFSDITNRLI